MRTLSHLLLTAGLGDQLRKRRPTVHELAFLLGSVLPDLPLTLLAAGYKLVQRRRGGSAHPASAPDRFGIGCHDLFHTDPLWISSYNLFHAPLVIGTLLLGGVQGQRRGAAWGQPLRLLALAWPCTAPWTSRRTTTTGRCSSIPSTGAPAGAARSATGTGRMAAARLRCSSTGWTCW